MRSVTSCSRAIFPITVATTAWSTIPRATSAAQNFGLGGWRLFKKVVIPRLSRRS